MTKRWLCLGMLFVFARWSPVALAQASPTATQRYQLSVFGGATGTFTDVFGGHNAGITVGADLGLHSVYGLVPSVEIRGMYPLKSGTIAGEKALLGGLKLGRPWGRLQPYGDFLAGRGEIDYQRGGFATANLLYLSSSSTVYSMGGGADYDMGRHWALKGDVQYQIWSTYPLESKTLKPRVVTAGIVYRFDFNHRYGSWW